ncbi:hypothetical protein BBJ28_00024944 [Nothophytophthora sp. Chile5]|nr:hypothetical protein BBJ28_00024944 [Nothophytophthora sp. Chile5]
MEALAYLARLADEDEDEDDYEESDGRLTPLDPEYWRGITHSHDVAPATHRYGHEVDANRFRPASYPVLHHQRPVTAPVSAHAAMHGNRFGASVLTSPIHYQTGSPMVPISPVAHMERMHDGSFVSHGGVAMAQGARRPVEWGSMNAHSYSSDGTPVATPQQLKAQLREAFVRAQAYLDLVPFFQSYDSACGGGVPLGTIQEALARMGVALGDHLLQGIGQLFGIPGSALVDYIELSRFLELDAHEV